MRITVSEEGGIAAAVPGLQKRPRTVDTQVLQAEGRAAEAGAIVDKVRGSGFFSMPDPPPPPPGAADFKVFTITVEDEERTWTIETTSFSEPPALRELRQDVWRVA